MEETAAFKLGMALLVGGAIGIERELRSKSAGFRTMILICVGACLFTIFSFGLGSADSHDRIAANIVVGIGFLGAGVIARGDMRVNGITTAASIWLTAALGMGIGSGFYQVSLLGAALVLMVLFLFPYMDNWIDRINQIREYKISYAYQEDYETKYETVIRKHRLSIKARSQSKQGNIITGTWVVAGSEKHHLSFIDHILRDTAVTAFTF